MIGPRRFFLRLAVALLAGGLNFFSLGDTVRQYGNLDPRYLGKDAGMAGGTHGNRGNSSNQRIGRPGSPNGWRNYGIFDWNRANIVKDMEQVARAEGWMNLEEAFRRGAVKLEFGVRQVSWEALSTQKTAQVGFFYSETAWVEGDGTDQDTNYNWTSNTAACTDFYAVDWRPGEGTPVPWREKGVDLANFRQLTIEWNSKKLGNFVPNQFTYVVLDPPLWWKYLNSTNAGAGLVTRDGGTGGNENLSVYTNGQNPSCDPELRATIKRCPPRGTKLLIRGAAGEAVPRP